MDRTVVTRNDLIPIIHLDAESSEDYSFEIDRGIEKGRSKRAVNLDAMLKKASTKPDDYTARLLKYIPSEIIALFLTLDGLLRPINGADISAAKAAVYWSMFVFGMCVTPVYLWRIQHVK